MAAGFTLPIAHGSVASKIDLHHGLPLGQTRQQVAAANALAIDAAWQADQHDQWLSPLCRQFAFCGEILRKRQSMRLGLGHRAPGGQ
jgi:hypothetical protein